MKSCRPRSGLLTWHLSASTADSLLFTFKFMPTSMFMFMPMSMFMSISFTGSYTVQVNVLEVDAGAFLRFRTCEREAKKRARSVKKKEFEKSKSAKREKKSVKENKREFAQSHSAGEKQGS